MSKLIHIIFKDMIGSGRTVAKQLSKGEMIEIEPLTALKGILSHSEPGDRIVFHGRKSLVDSLVFLIFAGITERNRIIYNPHTNMRPTFLNRLFLNLFTDVIISFTKCNKKQLDRHGFKNVIVIPNPIPLERLSCADDIKPSKIYDFVWAGRNVPLKRMELFIYAMSRMPEASGIILADRFEPSQKEMARNVGNRLNIKEGLNGFEFFNEFLKGKAFVFTSTDAEGFPIILLEAIYLGIPILAPNTEKYREILKDEAIFWKDEQDLQDKMAMIIESKLPLIHTNKLLDIYNPANIIKMYEAIA